MNKKWTMVILSIVGIGCFIFLNGCAPTLQIAGGLAGEAVASLIGQSDSNKIEDEIIEKYIIGKNTVTLYRTYEPKEDNGIFFVATDESGKYLNDIFYHSEDENDMQKYNQFQKMNSAEKKQYIRKDFIEYANIDLGPIEPEIVTTAPAPATPTHMPTTSFAPAVTPASY